MKTIHHNYSSLGLSASQSCGFVSVHKHNTADISPFLYIHTVPHHSYIFTKCILSYIISCISLLFTTTCTHVLNGDGLYNIHFVYLWNIQMICLLWHTYSKCIATLAKKTRNKWQYFFFFSESVYRMYRTRPGHRTQQNYMAKSCSYIILALTVNWINFSHV